jgi:aspartate--ammonia ligase
VLELSSMGIRVDKEALLLQFNLETIRRNILREKAPKTIIHRDDVLFTDYHKEIINETMPLTIGGGIGQSRISMFFLEKAHIGEVQVSEWSYDVLKDCKKRNIKLL